MIKAKGNFNVPDGLDLFHFFVLRGLLEQKKNAKDPDRPEHSGSPLIKDTVIIYSLYLQFSYLYSCSCI